MRHIRTKPTILQRIYRVFRMCKMQALCLSLEKLRDEKNRYYEIGMTGPIYMRNTMVKELAILRKIRRLQEQEAESL